MPAQCASKRAVNGAIYLFVLLCFLAFGSASASAVTAFTREEIRLIAAEAQGHGWAAREIEALFRHNKVNKMVGLVEVNVTQPIKLSHDRYKHYTHAESIDKAQDFSRKWRTQLERASRRYKVDPEVIVGILLVETNLGLYKGDHPLISVFPSIFVETRRLLANREFRDNVAMKKRLLKKNAWALQEFKALLQMKKRFHFDLYTLKGSYAGAFGLAQFLPSSYVKWAVRSNTRGRRADLYYEPDAIHSVANYLRAHGYRIGATKRQRKRAVWSYNNSDVYVDTVFGVAYYVKKRQTLASRE